MYFTIIRGPGGTGKTTVAHLLAERIRTTNRCALLASDDYYWGVSGEEHDDDLVFEAPSRLTDLYLSRGYSVIVEGQLTSISNGSLRIERIVEQARRLGARVSCFSFDTPLDVVEHRIAEKCAQEGRTFDAEETRSWYARAHERRLGDEVVIDAEQEPEQIVDVLLEHIGADR